MCRCLPAGFVPVGTVCRKHCTSCLTCLCCVQVSASWVCPCRYCVQKALHKLSHLFVLCAGVCPAGTYPLRCGVPAHPGHRHGHHAGENHHHQEGIHHLCAGQCVVGLALWMGILWNYSWVCAMILSGWASFGITVGSVL